MTDELFQTPMAGNVLIYWSVGEDEDGVPLGYVGTPKSTDDIDAPVRKCVGCDIAFATELAAFDEESMAIALYKAASFAVGKYILPKLVRLMFDACIELRERNGGFDQEKYDKRVNELIAEYEAQSAEENQSDED